jgi:hypothetical protein
MLEALRANFRDSSIVINDLETLSQMQTFTMLRGKLQAQDGSHDDAVMACAGASQMKDELPVPHRELKKNYLDDDDPERAYLRKLERGERKRSKPKYNLVTGALED